IFGKVSPAGRLVQTWPSSITDLPPILDYNIRNNRTYMYFKGEALFPFGYVLTYTSFEYSDLVTDRKTVRNGDTLQVSLTVRNTGDYDSDEVVQLYVSFPDSRIERPSLALKGFRRVFVHRGEEKRVTIAVVSDDLKYWDTEQKTFVLEKGKA